MSQNVLDSYLVKLGSAVDTNSFNKFHDALKQSQNAVSQFSKLSVEGFAAFEVAAIGAISSIGLGLIGLADKTASTDQAYRLFGMHMVMSKDNARAMQLALDDLGASMGDIAADPELNARFQVLYARYMKLGDTLGKGFDHNMVSIRGVKMEVGFLSHELELLGSGTISKVFEKLGYSEGGLEDKLKNLGQWFETEMPGWSDKISTDIIPVWETFESVAHDVGDTFKQLAGDFTFLTGVMSGDNSLQTTEFSLKNLAKAFEDIVIGMGRAVLTGDLFMKMMGHLTAAIGADFSAVNALVRRDMKKYHQMRAAGDAENDKLYNDVLDNSYNSKNPDLQNIIKFENMIARGNSSSSNSSIALSDDMKSALSNPAFLKLLYGISKTESSHGQFDAMGHVVLGKATDSFGNPLKERARGKFQLLPSTAKHYGVDPDTEEGNTLGAAMYLNDLLHKHHGDVAGALAEYGGFKKRDPSYYTHKVDTFAYGAPDPVIGDGKVTIGNITINVPKSLPDHEWHKFVKGSVEDILKTGSANSMAQTAGGSYY
jgi:hypothetical protein